MVDLRTLSLTHAKSQAMSAMVNFERARSEGVEEAGRLAELCGEAADAAKALLERLEKDEADMLRRAG